MGAAFGALGGPHHRRGRHHRGRAVFQSCTFSYGDLAQQSAASGRSTRSSRTCRTYRRRRFREPDPVAFEPGLALDGGADGLALYRRLIAQLPPLLAPGAGVLFEAAPGTIEALARLVAASFPGVTPEIKADYAGLPRFLSWMSLDKPGMTT